MLVGTCRIWRGPRAGGSYTALSPNFDTLGSGSCSGSEVNQVRAIAAGGPTDSNGSLVIYATTSGYGPLDGPLYTPPGGHVWFTGDATSGPSTFSDVTNNGPQGSINPNQFPLSSVAIDSSDATGYTAYVTVMGFTGGTGHVWKTTNAGTAWTDFTGNLPDAPVNAVVVDSASAKIYVATDVGVFLSSTSVAAWTELGPVPAANQTGYLPNVAVTALALFNSGGQNLLRASTYGRGIWQFNLVAPPDYQLAISNSPQTVVSGHTATFSGTATALNGYANSVALSCVAGTTKPPSTCSLSPPAITPASNTPFTVTAGGIVGDYYFNVQGLGADSNQTTHQVGVEFHILSNNADFAVTEPTSFPTVNAGSTTTSGPISVTAINGFTGTISLTCSLLSGNGSCSVNPSTVTTLPSTPSVTVNASALSAGSYQLQVQGTSGSTTHRLLIPFNVGDYQLLSDTTSLTVGQNAQGTANLTIKPSTYYSGTINPSCDPSTPPGVTCGFNPNPAIVRLGSPTSVVATINVASGTAPGTYNVKINTHDITGAPSHSFTLVLTVVADFVFTSSTASQTVTAGQTTAPYNLTVAPVGTSFNSSVTLSCSAGLPPGAQCLFNPTSVTPGTSSALIAMTISTSCSTALRSYPVTVTAASPSLSHSLPVTVVVSGDFQSAVTQAFPANVDAGSSQSAQVAVTPNYCGSVNAICDASAILGAQCTMTPANPVAISPNSAPTLTVAINLPNIIVPGPYTINLTVADSSGQPKHTIPLPLTVIQDFSVTSLTSTETVAAGQTTAPYQLTIAPSPQGSSFSSALTLSCSGLPAGAQCLFNPSILTPGKSAADVVMLISTSGSTAAGSYTVTVAGTSSVPSLSRSTTVSLLVTGNSSSANDFQLAVSQPFGANIDAGSSATAQVSVTSNYKGSLTPVSCASAISGAQCTVSPNPLPVTANKPAALTVTVNLPNSTMPAAYTVDLTLADASSGQPSHTLSLPLTVIEDFTVSSATPSQTVTAGQTTGPYQLSVAPNPPGSTFPGTVTLSCPSGLPSGAHCVFNPSAPVTPSASVVMTISTTATTASIRRSSSFVYAIWLLFPGVIIGSVAVAGSGTRRRSRLLGSIAMLFLFLTLLSCGGVSSGGGGGGGGGGTPPGNYGVTVTGTSSGVTHSTQVNLVVN